MNRQETLNAIRQQTAVSVLIIGGGANGLGTFRDLALQGIDVILVDKGDFCSGASAASSHMVHGGIRYLENGEFRLVEEAVQERNRLLENAPHLVKPLATTIPIFRLFSGFLNAPLKFAGLLDKPGERGAAVIKIGLTLYDAYTRAQGTVPRHEFWFRGQSLAYYPDLNPDIACTATYYDAAMPSPERICLEVMLDGEQAHPRALAANYVSAIGAAGDSVTLRDELSGETFTVQPRLVINAAGPWIDFANNALGKPSEMIGGTKGSHIVVNHPQLRQAIRDREFFFENEDGRIVLIYPFLDKVMIGTSDIPVKEPDSVLCTDEEIDYFLKLVKRVFPDITVSREQIVFRFAGVRPLPSSTAANAGQISRDHSIQVLEPDAGRTFPIYCLVGGKWTTFRAFAEQTTDQALAFLQQPRRQSTADLPIGGGRHYPRDPDAQWQWLYRLSNENPIPYKRLRQWFERYGTRLEEIIAYSRTLPAPDNPLMTLPTYTRHEILFLLTQEKVVHLDDLLLRRTLMGMLGDVTTDLVREVAMIVGEALGWDGNKAQAEIQRTVALLNGRHGLNLS